MLKNKMCMKKIERHTTNTRKGGRNMTNRNGSKGSGNQGSPKSGQFNQEFSTEFETGNDNKGKEYRSKKGVNQKGVKFIKFR